MENQLLARIRKRASNPKKIYDMARGLSPAPRLYPPATLEQIEATEAALGFPLPGLLRQLYLEIANGGFGPGYGLIGAQGGYSDFGRGAVERLYHSFHAGDIPLPERLLPVCNWGCGIYSCLDCRVPAAPVVICDTEAGHVLDGDQIQATLTDANGAVLWTYKPEAAPEPPPSRVPLLIPHRPSFEDWIEAWASGVDLWAEMETL